MPTRLLSRAVLFLGILLLAAAGAVTWHERSAAQEERSARLSAEHQVALLQQIVDNQKAALAQADRERAQREAERRALAQRRAAELKDMARALGNFVGGSPTP